MSDTPRIIVITGPTATGKSELGVRLAEKIGGEIVSADSMQVYKYMDIGTAKPTIDEMRGIPHHLIGFISPDDDYSVARYIEDASSCIHDILQRKKQPILVGGTGLYIDSLLSGRFFSARGDEGLREKLEAEFEAVGGDVMLGKLREVDVDSAARLHSNDKKRIVRALEIFEATGKSISQHDKETKSIPPRYNATKFALNYSQRAVLYKKIDSRVDEMIAKGLEGEVKALLDMGVTCDNTSMQAIGYKEISSSILSGSDIGAAAQKVKMESRRYAKRQLTWLRRDSDIKWIAWDDVPDIQYGIDEIMEFGCS